MMGTTTNLSVSDCSTSSSCPAFNLTVYLIFLLLVVGNGRVDESDVDNAATQSTLTSDRDSLFDVHRPKLPLIAQKFPSDRESLSRFTEKALCNIILPEQSYELTLSNQNFKFLGPEEYHFGEDRSITFSKSMTWAEILIRPDIGRDTVFELLETTLRSFSLLHCKVSKSAGLLCTSESESNLNPNPEDRIDWIKLEISDSSNGTFEIQGPLVLTVYMSINRRLQRIVLISVESPSKKVAIQGYQNLVYTIYTALSSEKMTLMWLGFEARNEEANDYYRVNNETR